MFGHEDVTVNVEVVSLAKRFEPVFEAGVGGLGVPVREASVATEGEEV